MEAGGEPQHRTQVNPCAGSWTWVSAPGSTTPGIRPWSTSIGGGGGGTLLDLTPGDLSRSASGGRTGGGNDDRLMPGEKSDRLIVARKPGNSGEAKGTTSC